MATARRLAAARRTNPFGLFGGGNGRAARVGAPAPKSGARHRAPSRREMEEQLKNAHGRAERAVDRIEHAEYGTYAYEEALRLGKLAQRHLERTEAKAFDEHGIEPRGQSGLSRLLRRPAKERPRRTGLGELLFQEGERQRERRRRSPAPTAGGRATAKTRPYTPVGAASPRGTRRKGAPSAPAPAPSQAQIDETARQVAARQITGNALGALFHSGFARVARKGQP